MNHIGNANKMVSDTPRTNAARQDEHDPYMAVASECSKMECELNTAHESLLYARGIHIQKQIALDKANHRIKRLEEAGNELRECASRIGTVASGEGSVIRRTKDAIKAWDKEVKL